MGTKPTYEELEHQLLSLKTALSLREKEHKEVLKLYDLFDRLEADPDENINTIVEYACDLLGATCSLYNRLDNAEQSLVVWSGCNLPENLERRDTPYGHICYEATIKGKHKPIIIEDLRGTPYEKTDPTVKKYGLRSYLGFPVRCTGKAIGSLCIVDVHKRAFAPNEVSIISTLAKAISLEEERKHAVGELQASKSLFEKTIESQIDAFFILDGQSPPNIINCNRAAEAMFGYKRNEMIGQNICFLYADETVCKNIEQELVENINQKGFLHVTDTQLKCKDESVLPTEHTVVPLTDNQNNTIGWVSVIRDISKKKELESKLQHASKMESLGILTGGIAHDFNNILGIILGNVELALDEVPDWNMVHFNLEEIKTATIRAKKIVRQLLSFRRSAQQQRNVVEMTPVIKEAVSFLRSTLPTTIDVQLDMSAKHDLVEADPIDVHQLFMNLGANASQAMEGAGGVLRFTIDNFTLKAGDMAAYPDLAPGDFLRIGVSDTGHGIQPDIIHRIFEPYFTTKDLGQSTGMGLWIVHGIIKNHKGSISVNSTPGSGANFMILFPLVSRTEGVEPKKETLSVTDKKKILFIDDENSIVVIGRKMLTRLGYEVTALTKPTEALEFFRKDPNYFDLVITDMTMPKTTGLTLFKAIRELRKDIPVILCTGHSDLINEDKALEQGLDAFILKPLDKKSLNRVIQTALDRHQK